MVKLIIMVNFCHKECSRSQQGVVEMTVLYRTLYETKSLLALGGFLDELKETIKCQTLI